MGIFAYHIGKMDIPEEHREEWVRQVLELLRAGGMMTIDELRLYKKKIYLLSPPELDEEGRATGYYNYFEKECWEDWWLNAKRGDFKRGRFFTQEPSPLYPPRSARAFHRRGIAIPASLLVAPIAPLPRKRLASSATGGASALSLLRLAAPAEVVEVKSLGIF